MANKTTQSEKARMGAIGESMVVAQLMAHGWDAFNANCTIKNFKTIDIVCIDGDSTDPIQPCRPKIALVQVKTSVQSNIPAGFTIGQTLDREYLEKNVMGPYVFVSAKKGKDNNYSFEYYILSRSMFIELVYAAHKYYVEDYNRKIIQGKNDTPDHLNGVNLKGPSGLYTRWLEGKSDPGNNIHKEFLNPLNGVSCKDAWENIWKD